MSADCPRQSSERGTVPPGPRQVKQGRRGTQLLFLNPLEALKHIHKATVAPHGMVHQGTIVGLGHYVTKDRPTNDQSFSARKEGRSINDRCLMSLLTPCVFGHALFRVFHFILHLRRRFPHQHTFLQKMDFEAAYCRMHLSASMAAKYITIIGDTAYLSLRLPFGGRPACPSLWSDFSE
jgi:hypothetical protein